MVYAKLTIDADGEVEVRQHSVIHPSRPGERYTLISLDISELVQAIEDAEREPPPKAS